MKKSIKNKLLLGGIMLGMMLLLAVGKVNAQTTTQNTSPVRVATVNVYNAKIVSQTTDSVKVGFDIFNRVGIQPDVRYSINLLQKLQNGARVLVDQKVYDEVLNLGENQLVHREVTYNFPPADGQYEVWVTSASSDAFPFGQGFAGTVDIKNTAGYVKLSSCFLTIKGAGNTTYDLSQGVDVAGNETLSINCTAQNNFKTAVVVTPSFETRARSSFGQLTQTANPANSISLSAGEKKNIIIEIPKATAPQAYNAIFSLKDSKNNQVSNSVTTHYVIQGGSATVQNITLDKGSYKAGDSMGITLLWSGPADMFPNSRFIQKTNPTEFPKTSIELSVSSAGTACIAPITKELSNDSTIVNFSEKVIAKCDNPVASVKLLDSSNKVLADKNLSFVPTENPSSISIPTNKSSVWSLTLISAIIIILLILIIALIVYKKKISKGTTLGLFLFLVLASGSLFARSASADTFSGNASGLPGLGANALSYTVNLDKLSYSANETITVTGSAAVNLCDNSTANISLNATVNGTTKTVVQITDFSPGTTYAHTREGIVTFAGVAIFTAPSVSGPYTATFNSTATSVAGANKGGATETKTASLNMTYYVHSQNIFATPGSCGTGTINVSWNNPPGTAGYDLLFIGRGYGLLMGNGTSYSDTGLTPGTSYTYVSQPVDPYGKGFMYDYVAPQYWITVTAIAPPVCPPPIIATPTPTNFVITPSDCGTGTLNLSWDRMPNATKYQLYRQGSPVSPMWIQEIPQPVSGSSITTWDTLLTPGTLYTYTLAAIYGSSDHQASTRNTGIAPAACVVLAPVISISASPTSGTVNFVNPTITWSATNSPTSCTASGDWSGTKATSNNVGQSQGVLTTAKTYTYTLSCTNAGGTGNASATVVVNAAPVMSGTLTSSSPSCFIASGASTCNVSLTWSTTNPVGTSSITSNYPSANTTVATGNTAFNVPFPVPHSGRTFYLYNKGVSLVPTSESPNGSGVTVTSSCTSGTVWSGTVCAAIPTGPVPTNLTVTTSSCGTGTLLLIWDYMAGASSYNVYRLDNLGNPVFLKNVVQPSSGGSSGGSGRGSLNVASAILAKQSGNAPTTVSTTDTGLSTSGLYGYQVTALYTSASESIKSSPVQYAFAPSSCNQPPTAPVITGSTTLQAGSGGFWNFVSTDPQGDQIKYGVDWNRDGNVDNWLPSSGYVASGTAQNIGGMSWPTAGQYTFQALTCDTTGGVTGCSAWTTYTVTVTSPIPTATISANPNPVNYGTASNITWSSTNATSCSVTKAGSAWQSVLSGSNVSSGNLTISTTFSVSCTGVGGTASNSVTVGITAISPAVITTQAANTSTTQAISGGNITSNGGSSVQVSGCVWDISTNPDPTYNPHPTYNPQSGPITGSKGQTTNGAPSGSFSCNLTGLAPGGNYKVSAYAKNTKAIAYGAYLPFNTGAGTSGTLSASPTTCVIAAGASSCTGSSAVKLTWTTQNPVGFSSKVTSDITDTGVSAPNTTIATANNGGPMPVVVPWGGRTFYLYNNAVELAIISTSTVCAGGTSWQGDPVTGKCVTNPISAPTIVLESPLSGATVSGIIPIKGYAVPNPATTIKKVEFWTSSTPTLVASSDPTDSKYLVNFYGLSRGDLVQFPAPRNIGFSYPSFDTHLLPDGGHTIIIKAYDNAGNISTINTALTVQNTPPPVVDGQWGPWGACSVSCGGGYQTRLCNSPAPTGMASALLALQTGALCTPDSSGDSSIRICNTQICPDTSKNGLCDPINAPVHFGCTLGGASAPASNPSGGPNTFTWSCNGSGSNGTSMSCSESKSATCDDTTASNYGKHAPCQYVVVDTPLCDDSTANNFNNSAPCTYNDVVPQCDDSQANNRGGSLPCTYDPGKVCNNPFAHNFEKPLPCTYLKKPVFIEG